jgi:hypothetical protein
LCLNANCKYEGAEHHVYVNSSEYCRMDATEEDGTLGRLINDAHVRPNSVAKLMEVDGQPHICIFASANIAEDEELRFNYGTGQYLWRKVSILFYLW